MSAIKRTLVAALLLVMLSVSYWGGRLSAPAAVFAPAQAAEGGSELDSAWQDFIRAQQQALNLMVSHPFNESELDRAEAYRAILYSIVGGIRGGALADTNYPRFQRAVDWSSKSGLDNPDNNYYIARINDRDDYLISGQRGSTSDLVFQLVVGQPGVRGAGSSTNVSLVSAADMVFDEQGRFEVVVSRTRPDAAMNWLPSGDGAETLLVRYSHDDWQREQDHALTIENLSGKPVSQPILTEAKMAAGLRDAAASLHDRVATWLRFSEKLLTLMPRNGISSPRPTQGGLVGQYAAFGSWDLNDDEALILTSYPSEATYQGIELGSRWFVSLNYATHLTSLTPKQSYLSADGAYRYVVSASDPGIANWLSTEQHAKGLFMLRWQGLQEALPEARRPHMQKVRFSELEQYLPADTPSWSTAERAAQLQARNLAVQQRFGG